MSSRRDRRRHGGEVTRYESDRRSADHCSSDEYEDYDRAQGRRSEQRHRRSDSRHERSRSRDRHHSHRSSDRNHRHHADEKRSRHRPQRPARSEADDELEEGQFLEDEDCDNEYTDRREETPNSTIMLRGLPPDTMENDGRLDLSGCPVSLYFSFSKEALPDGSAVMQKNDWTCYKCGVNNFKRRDVCFKCETGREESEANDTGDEISPTPTNCLILRNLSAATTADQILTLVSSLTNAPIRSIRFPKDPVYHMPRGVCYLELHTSSDAVQLMALISDMDTSALIESAPLILNYAKRSSAATNSNAVSTNAASVALAAAQWTNQTASGSASLLPHASLGVVSVNGVTYTKFPKPDPSTFQLESSSGFYYDSNTRLYYDPKSTYYFNSVTQQYLYWSDEYQTYLPPEQTSAATNSDTSLNPEKTPDKVKSAKKIAKDMEKWAKTLNQKTVSRANTEQIATSPLVNTPVPGDVMAASASQTEMEIRVEPEVIAIDAAAVRREEESKLIDWSKLLCLLCKRQFTSVDQLTKHQQVSDLHRNNLDAKIRSILSAEQLDSLQRRDGQYVDRAGERRRKWGNEEAVEPNPMKEMYLKEMSESSNKDARTPIGGENKGSKMLKAMGWQEGQGLGKKNKGRTDIIHVQQGAENAGLGARVTVMRTGESYKDAVKRAAAQRYKDLVDE